MFIAPNSQDLGLNQLLMKVHNGSIQLPEFQRDWTWDDHRIRAILASLSQGYPMGAIMRLQYGGSDVQFKYRSFTGVVAQTVHPEELVLDGQQRLTAMYQATYSSQPVVTKTDKGQVVKRFYYLSIDGCLDATEDRFDAVISVPEDRKIKKDFDRIVILDLSTHEKEYEHRMFPMNIVFDLSASMNWCMGYLNHYGNRTEFSEKLNLFQNAVMSTITNYKLPVITLDKSTPREAVCKVFENVNTGGVALTVFELVTASFAIHEFDLRKDWQACRNIIEGQGDTLRTDLFDGVDETTFLTTVALYKSYKDKRDGVSGSVSCKKKDVLSLSYNSYRQSKDAVLQGYQMAREFLLKEQFIFRKRDLPYTTQLIPLVAICAVLGKSKCREPNTIAILSKWYWCGILGEMYGGANETRYANDIEDVIDEVTKGESANRTVNAAFFSSPRLLTLQTRLSAAYKGILALLYKERCRDFMNNTTIDIVNSMLESPDIHHIFPEAYCERQNIKRQKYNSIVNKTPMLPVTNRSIGGHAPGDYLQSILRKVKGLETEELRNRIESHFIDYNLLSTNDFDVFFIERAKALLKLIEKAMGKTIADKTAEATVEVFGAELV